MDKNAIKKYAVWARRELIERVAKKAQQFGIEKQNIVDGKADIINDKILTASEKRQRQALIARIEEKEKDGYEQVMEEVAYTWFNRFSALRFMEVNGYLPTHVRVFTDEENNFKPQILTEAIHLDMDGLDMEKVYAFKDANKIDELYKYLLITQCNALNSILPGMFQKIEDYTELLFPDNLLREGSVIEQMVAIIPEEDWRDAVQIIGWLYQYYNSEKKDDVFAALKKKIKITKENIPAATQLFTPDWIVRYMVENSLGRLWLEGHPNDELKSSWKYYIDEVEQEDDIKIQLDEIRKEYANIKPKEIKCIDPCCGSGHILVYIFDILMQIYGACGYTNREAALSIVENNLYGLDIDDRASQLASFAVMMIARKYDRKILNHGVRPHIYKIDESNCIDNYIVDYFCKSDDKLTEAIHIIIKELHGAKEYGSIIDVTQVEFSALYDRFEEIRDDIHIYQDVILNDLLPLVQVAETLAQKYDVVVTNPPYMTGSNIDVTLNTYIKKHYPNSKADLFAVFMERCISFLKPYRFQAMITQQAFLFSPTFTNFRDEVVFDRIVNMIHIGFNSFPELNSKIALGVAFVMFSSPISNYMSKFLDLNSLYPPSSNKEKAFWAEKEKGYCVQSKDFINIPNHAITYSFSKAMLQVFSDNKIEKYCISDGQTKTGNNDKFLKNIWEVSRDRVGKEKKWSLIAKGGDSRKWYGNILDVIDWSDTARKHYKSDKVARIAPDYIWYRKGICWNHIATSKGFAARFLDENTLFETASPAILIDDFDNLLIIMAFLNTPICRTMMELLNPSVCKNVGDVTGLPLKNFTEKMRQRICLLSQNCIEYSKIDWDSFELSWHFNKHPLIKKNVSLKAAFEIWSVKCDEIYDAQKVAEEEINQHFIELYGLQDEIAFQITDNEVTVRKADLQRDIKSLISYAVGCMFGRYSLDVEGLVYAGGEWDDSKYITYPADKDNIIPICDDEYFEDDVVGRFMKFIEVVYGKNTLQENLKFIADALGGKGQPKEVIRGYFLNNFYKDHCKIYQKRPIYWQFDSGKKNGFRCLIYMHRYEPDTIARIRTDYVHEQQSRYRTAIEDLEQQIMNASTSERVKLNKKLLNLQAQASEIKEYEEKIHHLADQMIRIDLDDGVKKNYEKFKDVLAKIN